MILQSLGELLKSASKIVFLLIAVSACIGFFTSNLGEDNFMKLALMAFAFYFASKGETNKPYAGK